MPTVHDFIHGWMKPPQLILAANHDAPGDVGWSNHVLATDAQ